MLKPMTARRAGPCACAVETCRGIKRGDSIVWDTTARQAWHSAHGITGVDSRADAEHRTVDRLTSLPVVSYAAQWDND